MAEKKLKLKLLVDSKTNRVVYAEAGKEFVDFLFHILSLPVGTVVQLLNVDGMGGCIGSLYKSVESLDSDYFLPDVNKDIVLKPKAVVNVPLLKLNDVPTSNNTIYKCGKCCYYASPVLDASCPDCHNKISTEMKYVPSKNPVDMIYKCGSCCVYVSPEPNTTCPRCCIKLSAPMKYVPSQNAVGGYVKEMVRYMVMDDLEVKPLSTVSGLAQINKLNVKDVSAIIEEEVEVGFTEGLAMLKASFEVANTVLTTVFLTK